MAGDQTPKGPDLTAGIPLADIPEGGMVAGQLRGEAVLVVRRGEEVFAIGATCTHYGGPLAEGLLVGDTLRCPWHHACFSLRTGEAVRPPALNPVTHCEVRIEDGRVIFGDGLPGRRPEARPGGPSSVYIVGAGAAGNVAAETLRAEGYAGPITMIGGDDSVPYDRPNLSKDYLAGNAPEEWIPLRPREFYAERGIELLLGRRVAAIDTAARTLTLDTGEARAWGALLLATGAEPVRLTIPGADLPHVRYLRTLGDSRAIIERLGAARRAVVLGASFIGLEVAASLRTRGLEVTVVAPGDRPLGRILGPELGDFVRALHEEHGVAFRLGTTASEITPAEVRLANCEALPAELVVAGIGVRPAAALAREAGLAVEDGVLVDEHLETSVPGLFAAGDIASYPDPRTDGRTRVEHWVVAERQGQTAARNLLGRRERYDAVPFFWSQHYDVSINYVGNGRGWDAAEVAGSLAGRDATIIYRRQGRIIAVATVFRDRASLEAELAMERGDEQALAAAVTPA